MTAGKERVWAGERGGWKRNGKKNDYYLFWYAACTSASRVRHTIYPVSQYRIHNHGTRPTQSACARRTHTDGIGLFCRRFCFSLLSRCKRRCGRSFMEPASIQWITSTRSITRLINGPMCVPLLDIISVLRFYLCVPPSPFLHFACLVSLYSSFSFRAHEIKKLVFRFFVRDCCLLRGCFHVRLYHMQYNKIERKRTCNFRLDFSVFVRIVHWFFFFFFVP